MGGMELKIALRQEGEIRAREFWKQAEAEVNQRRVEIETELSRLNDETERFLQGEISEMRSNLLFQARTEAMKCRLHTEASLSQRLFAMATKELRQMAMKNREQLWEQLCKELPAEQWTEITVHPDDMDLASRDFPSANLLYDTDVSGGLVASNIDRTVRIDNSLLCRLKRAWPLLIPNLIKDLRKQVDNNATSSPDHSS